MIFVGTILPSALVIRNKNKFVCVLKLFGGPDLHISHPSFNSMKSFVVNAVKTFFMACMYDYHTPGALHPISGQFSTVGRGVIGMWQLRLFGNMFPM